MESDEMAWISGHHPHAHWANQADPWELLWLRIDGRAMEETCNILSVPRLPVFSGIPMAVCAKEFLRILELMNLRPLALDAMLNAAVAEILALLCENRQAEPLDSFGGFPEDSADVREALTKMALYPDRPWRVAALARLCRLSEPHFYRKFKQATGSTPIDWLRRERINHARGACWRAAIQSNKFPSRSGTTIPFSSAGISSGTQAWRRKIIAASTSARVEPCNANNLHRVFRFRTISAGRLTGLILNLGEGYRRHIYAGSLIRT